MNIHRNSIPPTTTLENLKIKANIAREEIYVDVGFWGGVVPGNEVNYLPFTTSFFTIDIRPYIMSLMAISLSTVFI